MKRRDLLKATTVAVMAAALPASAEEASYIERLGAEFDAAYAHAKEAALLATPLYKAWHEKMERQPVADGFQLPEYQAYEPYCDEWNRRSDLVMEIADRLSELTPTTMKELIIVARAEVYTWGSECLGDPRGLFDQCAEAQILAWAEDRIRA